MLVLEKRSEKKAIHKFILCINANDSRIIMKKDSTLINSSVHYLFTIGAVYT